MSFISKFFHDGLGARQKLANKPAVNNAVNSWRNGAANAALRSNPIGSAIATGVGIVNSLRKPTTTTGTTSTSGTPSGPPAPTTTSLSGTPTSTPAATPTLTPEQQKEADARAYLEQENAASQSMGSKNLVDAMRGGDTSGSTDTGADDAYLNSLFADSGSQGGYSAASYTPSQGSSILDQLRQQIEGLTGLSADEQAAQDELTKFRGDSAQSIAGLEGQGRGIVAGLVRGQQAKEQTQDALKEQTLMERLANASAQRQNALQAATQSYNMASQEQSRLDQMNQYEQQRADQFLQSGQANEMQLLQAGYQPITGGALQVKQMGISPDQLIKIGGKVYIKPATDYGVDVQEYEYAKDQDGYEGTLLDFLKEKEATTRTDGLSDAQKTSTFNAIVAKYNVSPLIQAADRLPVLESSINAIKQNPSDATQQLNLSYAYIQALDTYQSAVREGELGLINSIDSKIGQLSNSVQQMSNGQIVRPEVALQIAAAAQNIVDTIKNAAKQKAQSFASQANVAGVGSEWSQYLSGFDQNYNSTSSTGTQSNTGTPPTETMFKNITKLAGRAKADGTKITLQEANSWSQEARQLAAQGYSAEDITDLLNQEMGYPPKGSSASSGGAQKVAAAIKQVESGGNYNAKGGSGEGGAYQFMPATWKSWAGKYFGNANAQMTPENQNKVAVARIQEWLDQGYSPEQIALLWNSGKTTPVKGVNRYGVAYDSGAYAKKVLNAYNQSA